MTRILYVDVVGGAAGDMLIAALLDAGAPFETVIEAIEAVLPGRFRVVPETARRAGLRATWLRIEGAGPSARDAPRAPRPLGDLVALLDRASLPPRVAERARAILDRLAEAEARVHGMPSGEVTLHALGEDDTLLDAVGVAAGLEALGIERVLVAPIPLESEGWLPPSTGHGPVPLPAPVTLELLRGFSIRPGWKGEVVTPTAAAVFAALGAPATSLPAMRLESLGYGAGARDPEDRPNVVRVLLGTDVDAGGHDSGEPRERLLSVLEANLDDLSPELVADAAAALTAAGALDAWTSPVQMKKGRHGVLLSALCEPDREAAVRRAFFEHSTTFGVRTSTVRRAELERRVETVEVEGGSVRVKVGLLGRRVVSATPEHDDVAAAAVATDRSVREVYEEALVAARALRAAAAVRGAGVQEPRG